MLIDYAAITHQGNVRRNNEDGYLVNGMEGEEPLVNALRRQPVACPGGLLAAVADGMGGAAAGEIASREGLTAMAMHLYGRWGILGPIKRTPETLCRALEESTIAASHSVLAYSESDRNARGMGTTLTAAFLWEGQAFLCQIGDSRAYLYRRGQLVQLTQDQTLVNEMVASGSITEQEAARHPQRSMITQALGSPQPIYPVITQVALRRGDRLLLCTDGLHGEVGDAFISSVLSRGLSPKRTVELLVEESLAKGARDNLTGIDLALDDPALPLSAVGEAIHVLCPRPHKSRLYPGILSRFGRMLGGKP